MCKVFPAKTLRNSRSNSDRSVSQLTSAHSPKDSFA